MTLVEKLISFGCQVCIMNVICNVGTAVEIFFFIFLLLFEENVKIYIFTDLERLVLLKNA